MELKKTILILSMSSGILAIISSFLWWWGIYYNGIWNGLSMIDAIIWAFNNNWYVTLDPFIEPLCYIYYIAALILLSGGIITILNGFKPKKLIVLLSIIIISIGIALLIAFVIGYFIVSNINFIYFFLYVYNNEFIGLGPGFYCGIASLILCVFNLRSTLKLLKK